MSALARLSGMPDWPARMTAPVAACYMGISEAAFHARVASKTIPAGVKEGGSMLWAKMQLDAHIARQFNLVSVSPPPNGTGEIDTWADL